MLTSFINQPLFYFCLASAIFGLAVCLASEESYLKKQLRLALNQTGKVKIVLPLIVSVSTSFILTIVLKLVS
jgi:hypothetical protein